MKKFLNWTGKIILAVCLTLPMQTMANDVDFGSHLQAGDTIAGMTVTQASIDNVDRLMADMNKADSLIDIILAQSALMPRLSSEYCQREKPELANNVKKVTESWIKRTNPVLERLLNDRMEGMSLTIEDQSEFLNELRTLFIVIYLDTEQKADPEIYCPALIKQLKTMDVDEFVKAVEQQYDSYLQKSEHLD